MTATEKYSLPRRKALIVYNPAAGKQSSLFDRSLKVLEKLELEFDLQETQKPGAGEDMIREAVGRKSYDAVAVAGGDGTINEVANAMLGADLPLGIIPVGTVNLLAMEIGLAKDPEQIARSIVFGSVQRVNVGQVNGRSFLLMVGAGFDGRVVARVTPQLKKTLGRGAYVLMAFKELCCQAPAKLKVEVDGCYYNAAWVIVSNGRYYGARFPLAPAAGLSASGFSVSLLPKQTRWGLLCALLAGFKDGNAKRHWTHVDSADRVLISSQQAEVVQADGDFFGTLPVTITHAPQGLNLIMPYTEPP